MTSRRTRSWVNVGALAGLTGTIVLYVFETAIERAVLGRDPVYSVRRIVRRALPRLPRGGPEAAVVGAAVRSSYALALALGFARLRPWLPRSTIQSAALFAAVVSGAELVVMPRLGVVPPVSRWSRPETLLLFAHAAVFGLVTAGLASIHGAPVRDQRCAGSARTRM